ncbi:MAG: hypothetical protein K2X47_18510 [Bdellovibrionales bacterium]|nr:hypothetical protein [Bdellovibrionales bacterium]
MFFLDLKGLIEHLKENRNTEEETYHYLLAEYVLMAIWQGASAMLKTDSTSSSSSEVSSLPLALLGILAGTGIGIAALRFLYNCNGGSQGRHFLNRMLALGWVIGLRTLAVAIPVGLIAELFSSVAPLAVSIFVLVGCLGCLAYLFLEMVKALEAVSGRPRVIAKLPSEA